MSTEKYAVIAGWLCEVADGCTCGCGGLSMHEQYCGVQNLQEVDELLDEHERMRVTIERVRALVVAYEQSSGSAWAFVVADLQDALQDAAPRESTNIGGTRFTVTPDFDRRES